MSCQFLKLRRVLILLELLGVLVDSVVGQVDTLVPQLLLPSVERLRGEPAQIRAHSSLVLTSANPAGDLTRPSL